MRSPCDTDDVGWQGDRRALALVAAAALLSLYSTDPSSPWQLPEHLRELYTEGECEALADALHALTGWPVVVVGDAGGIAGWVHAGVRSPTGQVFDAEGPHDPTDWLTAWAPWVDAYGNDLDSYDPALVDVMPRPMPAQHMGSSEPFASTNRR
jgi:hypothetical protein